MAKKAPTLQQLLPQRYRYIIDLDELLAPARVGDLVAGESVPVEPAVTPRKAYSLDAILRGENADASDPSQK